MEKILASFCFLQRIRVIPSHITKGTGLLHELKYVSQNCNNVSNMKISSTFFPICDCRKSILLFGKEKSSDYKRGVIKSGMTVTGVHL